FLIDKIKDIKLAIKTLNISGLNVTVPFKKNIISELDNLDKHAKNINAINTIVYKNKKLMGYNTDILGFEAGLKKLKWNKEKPVVVFGAGGAAEAIIYFLYINKVKNITLINRTESKAKKIIKRYKNIIYKKEANRGIIKEAGLIINTTCLGMIGYPNLNLNLKGVNKEVIIYDIVYNPVDTRLILNAKEEKLSFINGLDMFIEQARCSFDIWFNIKPKIEQSLYKKIKKEIKKL
ncbi:MAG: shikimate dehydrogenase, partial [Rickettsiales bacterium]